MPNKNKQESLTGPHRFSMKGWISCAPFERLLHLEILEAAGGKSVLTMPFLLDLAQGAGLMHGGALVSLADTAVAMAIKSLVAEKSHFATISLEAKFLAPVKKGIVTARAEIVGREGRNWHGKATVFDEDSRPVLEFMSHFKTAKDLEIRGAVEFKDKG